MRNRSADTSQKYFLMLKISKRIFLPGQRGAGEAAAAGAAGAFLTAITTVIGGNSRQLFP